MQKPEDSFDSEHPEAQLPDALLQSLKDYANGPDIKVSEATDVFILNEARPRLNKETVAPMGRAHPFSFWVVAGLAVAFAVLFGLSFAIWSKQQPSGLQRSEHLSYAVGQLVELSDIQDPQDLKGNQACGDIPVIASFVAPGFSMGSTDFSGSTISQTNQTLPQLTGNIYSM